MEFNNIAAFGWLRDGEVEMRIACRKHMKPVSRVNSGGGTGPGVNAHMPRWMCHWGVGE